MHIGSSIICAQYADKEHFDLNLNKHQQNDDTGRSFHSPSRLNYRITGLNSKELVIIITIVVTILEYLLSLVYATMIGN